MERHKTTISPERGRRMIVCLDWSQGANDESEREDGPRMKAEKTWRSCTTWQIELVKF